LLGRDGLRAVPFFSSLVGFEVKSRTAQRPSLPMKIEHRRKWSLLAGSSEICAYRGPAIPFICDPPSGRSLSGSIARKSPERFGSWDFRANQDILPIVREVQLSL
jgi:hypothetical protein